MRGAEFDAAWAAVGEHQRLAAHHAREAYRLAKELTDATRTTAPQPTVGDLFDIKAMGRDDFGADRIGGAA